MQQLDIDLGIRSYPILIGEGLLADQKLLARLLPQTNLLIVTNDTVARLHDAGVLVSAEVLQPSEHATTLKLGNGKRQVQDGPYADTKEQIGGTFVIDVPDLDAALAWAEKCPAAQWGTVEIRPSAVRYTDGTWVTVS